jgi:hypothetical protein
MIEKEMKRDWDRKRDRDRKKDKDRKKDRQKDKGGSDFYPYHPMALNFQSLSPFIPIGLFLLSLFLLEAC